jgi:hypothetical protein
MDIQGGKCTKESMMLGDFGRQKKRKMLLPHQIYLNQRNKETILFLQLQLHCHFENVRAALLIVAKLKGMSFGSITLDEMVGSIEAFFGFLVVMQYVMVVIQRTTTSTYYHVNNSNS